MNHGIKHISIAKPCNQNWADMDIAHQGRFCQSCQKTVVDFAKMTNDEILALLSVSGNACGSFATGQLERVNASLLPPTKTRPFSFKKFGIAAAFIGFITLFKVQAQVKSHIQTTSVVAKTDTLLTARQSKFKIDSEMAQLKNDTIDISSDTPINPDTPMCATLGGVYVQKLEETPNSTTLELIKRLFKF